MPSCNQKSLFNTIIALLLVTQICAQQNVIVNPPDYIKSIVLNPLRTNEYAPVIQLGNPFRLEFDDLEGDQKEYRYKIEHFNYNWESSGLNTTEFLDGFNDDFIRNFENSFNTLQNYTHYSVRIPNDNLRIKISGNYVISIYNDSNEVVFSKPFIVYNPLVTVGVTAHRNRDISSINTKQNIQFLINHPNLSINNPSNEIKVAVYQNYDWNTVIKNIKPQFIRGSQMLYKYNSNINFWANNEYLFFDTKEIRNATNNVYKSTLESIFNTYLYSDEPRAQKPYTLNPDINGNFVLRTIDASDISIEGDYSWVHFNLFYPEKLTDQDVYIYGNFNNWQLTKENRMSYNTNTKSYQTKLLLKQGFYNYKYVTKTSDGELNKRAIEGSFYQTENDYSVLVYYKPYGSRYDQVIGFGNSNSEDLRN